MDALGDPTRRAILERLLRGPLPVGELARDFPVSRPAISQHLSALKDAGLVSERRAGRHAYYRSDPQGLAPLADWVQRYKVVWPERIEKLRHVLKDMEP